MKPYVLAPVGDRCGEGIVWVDHERAAYWVDMTRFLIHRCDITTRSIQSWVFDEPVVAVALTDRPDSLLVALASRLIFWRPKADRRVEHGFRIPGWPRVRLNDGRPDPAGNFWVGSMGNNIEPDGELGELVGREGILYRITPNGIVTEHLRGIGISNTVCWSPDCRRFYFADTMANKIWCFDYDLATAAISNKREFFSQFERGLPDGSCIDSEGYLWNCRYGGSCIVRIRPDGTVDRIVEMPTLLVTTCTFGGPLLETLLVTTASFERHKGDRFAGSLFAVDADVPGIAERAYHIV